MIASWQGHAVGVNRRLLWSPRAKRMVPNPGYRKFKESLAGEFMNHAERFDGQVYVFVRLIIHPRADADNLLKPILDALEMAGVITNDNKVTALAFNRENKAKGEQDRIVVVVEEEK